MRSRALLAAAAAVFAAPSLARAQEPQPWTNTSAYGDRVVGAFPSASDDRASALRADGGTGTTDQFRLTETRGATTPDGAKTAATFLSGRTAVSYGARSWEVFASSYAYQVSIPKLEKESTNEGPLAGTPFTQLGDATIGARWTNALGRDMRYGIEGGALFFGGTGEPGETGVVFAGPEFSATSPFARGLFTWRSGREESGGITASVNLGAIRDQSWSVWENAAKDAERDEVTDDPLEEERIAMSFYGDKGGATRILFGANVCYDVNRSIRPFLEVTGESTSPDLTMRVTPGLAVRAADNFSLFLSADMDLSGDPEVSPRAPAFRANAGLQLAFGPRNSLDRPRATPRPTSTPSLRGRGFPVSVRVVNERGQAVPGAKVRLYRAEHVPPNNELAPLTDELGAGEGTTNEQGAVTIPSSVNPQTDAIVVEARERNHLEWMPIEVPARAQAPQIVLYRDRIGVQLQFTSCGQPWTPPVGSRIILQPVGSGKRARTWTPNEPIQVPNHDAFKKWKVSIQIPDFGDGLVTGELDELPYPTAGIRLYVDAEKKCLGFTQAACPCAATVNPTPTPVAAIERTAYSIFEGDSIDVNKDEGKRLVTRLQSVAGARHRIVVQARKGDPIFQAAVAGARRDALLAWLNGQGILAGTVRVDTDSEAKNDQVILEVTK